MKARFKQFVAEKRAVSPVIGVVLMVAVVVILAAVIGAFVLGLGGQQQDTPQAGFSFERDGAGGFVVTHDGGDQIEATNLKIFTDGSDSGVGWNSDPVQAGVSSASAVTATDTIRVVYDDGNGETATLASFQV